MSEETDKTASAPAKAEQKPPAKKLTPEPATEPAVPVVESAEVATEGNAIDPEKMAALYESNGYPFCGKCKQRYYTDEQHFPICNTGDKACPVQQTAA